MSRGGSRPNAGRKSKSRELMIERSRNVAAKASITPLEYLLQIVQDTAAPDNRRFAAAVAAAPYVHPRLAAVAHSGNQDKPIVTYQIITGVPRPGDESPDNREIVSSPLCPYAPSSGTSPPGGLHSPAEAYSLAIARLG